MDAARWREYSEVSYADMTEPIRRSSPPGQAPFLLVQRFARRIRAAYVRARRLALTQRSRTPSNYGRNPLHWDDKPGKKKQRIWERLAEHIIGNSCDDPEGFIAAQFEYGDPNPRQLLSPRAAVKYQEWKDRCVEELTGQLNSETLQFASQVRAVSQWHPHKDVPEKVWQYVLYDTNNRLSPLFRYSLAVAENIDGVAAQFLDAALSQYVVKMAAYDAAWRDRVPAELRQRAMQIIQRVERDDSELSDQSIGS